MAFLIERSMLLRMILSIGMDCGLSASSEVSIRWMVRGSAILERI